MANADNVSVWTTVPVAVRDQLEAIAEKEERSISYIVRGILTRYLDTVKAEQQREELARAMTPSPPSASPPAITPAKPQPPSKPPSPSARVKLSPSARVKLKRQLGET